MGIRTGAWKTVTVTKDADPAVSAETDLEAEYRHVQVYSPAIDEATVTIKSSRVTGDTAVQPYSFLAYTTDDHIGDAAHATKAKATAAVNLFENVCARYVTILLSAVQTTATRTFYIRGIDPI